MSAAARVPPGRFGRVSKIAGATVFPVSIRASCVAGYAQAIIGGGRPVGAGPRA